ncbi:MAG: hypothetical protein LBH04_05550 [Tannerellaceae bacterium]|nr:hypothetical protein [Tannerellaceae bacterium]
MNTKSFIAFKRKAYHILATLFVFMSAFAQDGEKRFFENNPTLGGDVVIKSATVQINGNDISKTFEIESSTDGSYYLDAWIMVPITQDGYPEYKIGVNGIISTSTLKPQTDNWQSLALTDINKNAATVKLKKGTNNLSIIGKGTQIPNVEFVKLSSSPLNTGISDAKYKAYIESIKAQTLDKNVKVDSTYIETRGTNGEIYTYQLNLPVLYTYYANYSYSAGQTVNISSSSSSGYQYVIELFNKSAFPIPTAQSWVSYCSGSCSLNVTIPVAGTYMLRLRAYRQQISGLVNLTVNGTSYSNCVSASTGIVINGTNTGNFFTCKLAGGDTYLFLEESGTPGKIRGFNDDGGTKSDGYSWGLASRIEGSVNPNAGLVSAYSSNSPNFTCDLYLGLARSSESVRGYFPNLAADNSFMSAPATTTYNCFSWSVGVTST